MCLIALAFRQLPGTPVLLLGNREEQYARLAKAPQVYTRIGTVPAWMGGLDLQAGGTWLGVNERGVVVAVTNRPKTSMPVNPPSRGVLCRRLLAESSAVTAVAHAVRELRTTRYAGCNLLICDRDRAFVVESSDDQRITELAPGLHLLTNTDLGPVSDPRIVRARSEFARLDARSTADWLRGAEHICRLAASADEAPLCLVGSDRGTVCSTVLALSERPGESSYRHAQGPPLTTPHHDYSAVFNEFLEKPSNSIVADVPAGQLLASEPGDSTPLGGQVYRIYLRGPWQASPRAQIDLGIDGQRSWSDNNLPAPRTVRLPATWQELFGDFRGRIRFQRTFHPPSNIGSVECLYLALTRVGGTAVVSLNGTRLGEVNPSYLSVRFQVTGRLVANNELTIDLDFTTWPDYPGTGGLSQPVALEIVPAITDSCVV